MRYLGSLGLCLLASACASNANVSLEPFSDCEGMIDYMVRMADAESRERFGGGGLRWGAMELDVATLAVEDGGASAANYSTTNLQEAGVDEADRVKTDGTNLFSLAGEHLVISKVWPVEEAEQLSLVPIDGTPSGLYLLENDTVVVMSSLWGQPNPRSAIAPGRWEAQSATVVTIIDVSDPVSPRVLRETYGSGELKTSRRVGDKLIVVAYRDILLDAAADSQKEAKDLVRAAAAEDWLPRRFDNRLLAESWEADTEPLCACTDTWASEKEGGTFITGVLVLDLSDPMSEFEGSAVVGRADDVYATASSMYVAYSEWDWGPFASGDSVTDSIIHKFDITGATPSYAATAQVEGELHDRYSISEFDGVLRVATTNTSDWTSGVYTLRETDGLFIELDHITGLAPTEQIMSTRFIGTLGYVVTWEVTLGDPLFTFDLSDPNAIVLGGELHIPGWSDYLHPMDDDHLLAVGWDDGLAVSLFDVGDLSDPQLAERLQLDGWSSEAQWDPHAFNYYPPTESLSLPITDDWEGQGVLQVVEATPDGLDDIGTLHQPAAFFTEETAWCGGVRRSVVMEDVMWAVSSVGLTAAPVHAPGERINAVRFEGVDPCMDSYGGDVWMW